MSLKIHSILYQWLRGIKGGDFKEDEQIKSRIKEHLKCLKLLNPCDDLTVEVC